MKNNIKFMSPLYVGSDVIRVTVAVYSLSVCTRRVSSIAGALLVSVSVDS